MTDGVTVAWRLRKVSPKAALVEVINVVCVVATLVDSSVLMTVVVVRPVTVAVVGIVAVLVTLAVMVL